MRISTSLCKKVISEILIFNEKKNELKKKRVLTRFFSGSLRDSAVTFPDLERKIIPPKIAKSLEKWDNFDVFTWTLFLSENFFI